MDDAAFEARLKRYYALWRENNDIYAEWARRRGLSYFEMMVLFSLAEGECTQRDICAQWCMPKQTVHSILRQFQDRGWITLEIRPEDRRSKAVRLTPAGEGAALPLYREMVAHEQKVWAALGDGAVDGLMELQARYIRTFREVEA